ncbi:MAG: hypothetical protein DMF88_26620 [Acidobacteria bacterium]|nr:MAG: hypothetical protein DMF88_26620 [Acidobacteriota bacterium]
MKTLLNVPLMLTLLPSAVLAQTPTGQDVNATVSGYTYTEPSATSISIHGPKVGGEYTATLPLDQRRHWYAQGNVRGMIGTATYTGWCSPYLIRPNNTSPNGYELDIGDPSPCSENGDRDWYLEGRALAGKDVIRARWTWSPYAGVGLRHLSNGTTGVAGYRTDEYLYVPAGVTARTSAASRRALAFNVEVDPLIRGWQKTRDSALGGGDIPATPIAPAFTINSFSDVSFSQHAGWALRASATYQVTRHWSLEPYYLHWHVNASPVSYETVSFTVNHITAQEQLGAYEPLNATREFGVKLGFHF